MGNLLCREKTPRRVYVKGPVKGTAFDPQLFSNDSLVNGTRKDVSHSSINNKMFFSTPNLKSDMKSTISLDARIFDRGNSVNPPIAPPRKKRATLKKGSTLPSTFPHDMVPNGFKEVFGTNIYKDDNIDGIDYIDKEENSLQERSMYDEGTLTLDKKLKIGNKKSDKFFGESLSDHLSDELVSPIPEKELSAEDSKHITDKNLSTFLMNMLDDIRNAEDEEKYKGQIPVDEPACIVRKREIKHICDDDDNHIHAHTIHPKNDHDHAPPKPDRDFTKFKSATPNIDDEIVIETPSIEKVENSQAKVRVKRVISRENLPSPPATPLRKKGIVISPTTPTITIETSDASIKSQNINEKAQQLTNEQQNDEKITTDLVDLVINKAYGMSDFNYHPEDFSHHTHNDGSNLVTPTSKLAVRKISTPRKISTESAPSFDNEMINVQINKESSTIQKDSTTVADVGNDDIASADKKDNKLEATAYNGSNVSDIIDEIYNKNSDIMNEFQSFLEQSIVEKELVINVEDETKFLDSTGSLDDKANDHTKECHKEDFDDRSYSDSFESTDEEEENVKKSISSNVKTELDANKRRESIEDVDNWFSHHIEMDQKESDVCSSYVGEQRSSVGYDTNKIFPFGSTIIGRRDSQSDEFFTDISSGGGNQRMKQQIEPVQIVESRILEEDETKKENDQKISTEKRESSPDHSTLLKFLDTKTISETNE